MARKFIDCRDFPSDKRCTVALSADNEDELMEAAIQHGQAVHGYKDTPELRRNLREAMKEGAPPA